MIRPERESDHGSVHDIVTAAFGTDAEAGLVAVLRKQAQPLVSLVAEERGTIVGHILFSPVIICGHPDINVMGLAPMAVAPELQNRGLGSMLVRAGLSACRESGIEALVVLGHPEYYPRFGFVPSSQWGLDSEYDVPAEVFMAMELVRGALSNRSGMVQYHAAFGKV